MRDLRPRDAPELEAFAELLGPCRIPGALFDCGAFPALQPEPREPGIIGELYRLHDARGLARLDEYEGVVPGAPERSLFVRVRLQLLEPDVAAWVYVAGTVPVGRALGAGGWREHLRSRPGPADL